MRVGDLVHWVYTHSTLDIDRRRLGVIVEKRCASTSGQFWGVLIDGEVLNIQQECLEVVNESR